LLVVLNRVSCRLSQEGNARNTYGSDTSADSHEGLTALDRGLCGLLLSSTQVVKVASQTAQDSGAHVLGAYDEDYLSNAKWHLASSLTPVTLSAAFALVFGFLDLLGLYDHVHPIYEE
jgi:hypothetical protein